MAHIKADPTLRELQEYIAAHWQERGFTGGPVQECLLLAEEVGELAKAIRQDKAVSGMTSDANSQTGNVAHELADVLWAATAIANLYDIDLEQAFRDKEALNHGRTWQ